MISPARRRAQPLCLFPSAPSPVSICHVSSLLPGSVSSGPCTSPPPPPCSLRAPSCSGSVRVFHGTSPLFRAESERHLPRGAPAHLTPGLPRTPLICRRGGLEWDRGVTLMALEPIQACTFIGPTFKNPSGLQLLRKNRKLGPSCAVTPG